VGRFDGKAIIVTGAAQGMGRAIAERFARDGGMVLASDIRTEGVQSLADELTKEGHRAVAIQADVTDPAQVKAMVARCVAEFGGVDVLVNNAGVLRSTKIVDITPEEWDFVMAANVKGVFLCTQAVHDEMVKRGGGRIVHMASLAGRATSTVGGAHYSTSKAAVLGFMRHCAREWARDGITSNAVSPGMVDTPMGRSVSEERMADIIKAIPFGRLAEPEEVANLVCFLASDEAAYITGASVDIHGGELIMA
jgi:NAD(P)-dependent dehydrogenase (short-subunit alcohol dehydrogenase family)